MSAGWDPTQYERFRDERRAPFDDLAALVAPCPGGRLIDLGCGTGELTAGLCERLGIAEALGVDNAESMLAKATQFARPGLRFECADLRTPREWSPWDVVFSNAALQWVPSHEPWLATVLDAMKPGAQIAIHVPRNFDQPSHTIARALAEDASFRARFASPVVEPGTPSAERYATLLFEHGFRDITCFEKIYGHVLPDTGAIVEWVKGTLLNAYLPKLAADAREPFVQAYRARLLAAVGEQKPYYFTYRRLLLHGRKG